MPGRTPAEAVRAFTAPIQSALTCFADGRVGVDSYVPGTEGVMAFNRAEDVVLNGAARVSLSVAMRYCIVPNTATARKWKVSTTGWIYTLKDSDGALIADYHWHPGVTPGIAFPHVHPPNETATRRHLPTGRVLIEDVLALAIEAGAAPRDADKWERVCARNIDSFRKSATWGTQRP